MSFFTPTQKRKYANRHVAFPDGGKEADKQAIRNGLKTVESEQDIKELSAKYPSVKFITRMEEGENGYVDTQIVQDGRYNFSFPASVHGHDYEPLD